ncbi:MAG: hypothetical protein ACJ8FS_13585 [Sphingomicrobium sp.]
MKKACVVGTVALLCTIAGCSSPSIPVLRDETNRLVPIGMQGREATGRLQAANFKCGSNYLVNFTAGDILCDRRKSSHVLATCIQRVFLTLDPQGAVRKVDVAMGCASF